MTLEDQHTERKSLRVVSGRGVNWPDLAAACVGFANGAGGRLLIGIEDGERQPPPGQVVQPDLLERIQKRISELTINVQALPRAQRADNDGEFIVVARAGSSRR